MSGVVIQGGKHRDRNVFMKRFKVGHSLDGEEWTIVKEDNTTRPKVGLRLVCVLLLSQVSPCCNSTCITAENTESHLQE